MLGKGLFVLLGCIALEFSQAKASLVFADDFSYPDGALVVVCGGQWKTHSGTVGQVQVSAGQVHLSQAKSEDVSALFPGGTMAWTNTMGLYAGFHVNFHALPSGSNGSYFAHFKDLAATTGIRCRIFASTNGAALGCFRLGISSAANTPSALLALELTLGTRYRVVCRLVMGNNASTLWLNPAAETDPSVSSTDEPVVKSAAAFALRQSLAGGAGMGELTVDNLVIATSFEEVTRREAAKPQAVAVSITWAPATGITLSWPAEPTETYSVWVGDSITTGFAELASGLYFLDGAAVYEDGFPASGMRLYQICSP